MKPTPKSARFFPAWRNDCIGALKIHRACRERKRKKFDARDRFGTKSGAKSLDGLRSSGPLPSSQYNRQRAVQKRFPLRLTSRPGALGVWVRRLAQTMA